MSTLEKDRSSKSNVPKFKPLVELHMRFRVLTVISGALVVVCGLAASATVPLGSVSECTTADPDFRKAQCKSVRPEDIVGTLEISPALLRKSRPGVVTSLSGELVMTPHGILTSTDADFVRQYKKAILNASERSLEMPFYFAAFKAAWGWFDPEAELAQQFQAQLAQSTTPQRGRYVKVASYFSDFDTYDFQACVGHEMRFKRGTKLGDPSICDWRSQILASKTAPPVFVRCAAPEVDDGKTVEGRACMVSSTVLLCHVEGKPFSMRYGYYVESHWLKTGKWRSIDQRFRDWMPTLMEAVGHKR